MRSRKLLFFVNAGAHGVGKDHAMVCQTLRNRTDVFSDYRWEHFEALLRDRFTLAEVQESHGGARKLCLLLAKDS